MNTTLSSEERAFWNASLAQLRATRGELNIGRTTREPHLPQISFMTVADPFHHLSATGVGDANHVEAMAHMIDQLADKLEARKHEIDVARVRIETEHQAFLQLEVEVTDTTTTEEVVLRMLELNPYARIARTQHVNIGHVHYTCELGTYTSSCGLHDRTTWPNAIRVNERAMVLAVDKMQTYSLYYEALSFLRRDMPASLRSFVASKTPVAT